MEKAERVGGRGINRWEGRKIVGELEGEEKPFCQTLPFSIPGRGCSPVRSSGTCMWQLRHRRWSLPGFRQQNKDQYELTGKNQPRFSVSSLCLSVLLGLCCKRASREQTWLLDQGLCGCDASLSGPGRNHHCIVIIHLVKTAEKAEEEYQALLPRWLMAVAWRMS